MEDKLKVLSMLTWHPWWHMAMNYIMTAAAAKKLSCRKTNECWKATFYYNYIIIKPFLEFIYITYSKSYIYTMFYNQRWSILSVSLTNTLASNTKYWYCWISCIDTSISITGSWTLILVSVLLVKKHTIFTDMSRSIFGFQNWR